MTRDDIIEPTRDVVRLLAIVIYCLCPIVLIFLFSAAVFWTGMAYRDSTLPAWPEYLWSYTKTLAYIATGWVTHLWQYLLPILAIVGIDIYFRRTNGKKRK